MSLVKCVECGGSVSQSAQKCPHCGCIAFNGKKAVTDLFAFLISGGIICAILYFAGFFEWLSTKV